MAKGAYIGVDGVARKIKKGYIGVENFVPRALPSGYTQLSHIKSTGAQYFNTGFVPNSNTKAVVDYSSTATAGTVIGSDNSWLSNDFVIEVHFAAFATTSYNHTSVPSGRHTAALDKGAFVFDGETLTTMSGSFTGTYPLTLFALNRANSMCEYGTLELYSCQIYDNGKLVRDYVPCKNSSGTVGLYDMVNNTFGGSATSTAFVEGSSVQSVARKIKKAYIGIGGVARPCWSGGELAYYGTITPLSEARCRLAATTVGNYALFGGGQGSGASTAVGVMTIDAYNNSLTRTDTYFDSESGRYDLTATTVGNYALFGGGRYDSSARITVDSIDAALTRLTITALRTARHSLAATTVGDYALFGGGNKSTGYSLVSTVDVYDNSLVNTLTGLSKSRCSLASTTVGNYALFGGGYNDSSIAIVDTYDKSLTEGTTTNLSTARQYLAATTVGSYALFGGGQNVNGEASSVVDAYDKSLTRTTPIDLSVARCWLSATTLENHAIFGDGDVSLGGTMMGVYDIYDASLTRTTQFTTQYRRQSAATTVGNYALFGGGYAGLYKGNLDVDNKVLDAKVATVETFTVA